jgi:hypothetical protein
MANPVKKFTETEKAEALRVFAGKEPGWTLVDRELFIDGKSLNPSQMYALLEVAGADTALVKKIFRYNFVSKTPDNVLKKLAEQDLVEGAIKKGLTSWRLTKVGKETVKWVKAFLVQEAKEIEDNKATLKALPFDERLRAGYYRIDHETESEFKADLLADEGVSDNPLADKAYSIAYEHGHSSGMSEVRTEFYDLADLIREAAKMIEEARRGA